MRMNDSIRRAIETHDLVIYQSSFSKIFAERMLGVRARKDCVIYNGTSMVPSEKKIEREDIIVACSRWRTNKRPKAIARAFVHASDDFGMVAKLFFVGDVDPPSRISHHNIYYIGSKNHDYMRGLYHRAKLMIHVCHLDSCPNSVVEGLRMGLPVLCNNIGGTKELIDENCMISNIDREFSFRPVVNMDQVGDDAVDCRMLGRDMSIAFKKCKIKYREDMSMTYCASKYAEEIRKNI
jgi:glycosyltransferase involved in cell wall biosynthesis